MQETMSRAIILVPAADPLQTPFGKFMEALYGRSPKIVTTTIGTAAWSNVPYSRIVAFGLWKIMEQVARTRNVSLSTENAVDGIARLVGHLIDMGMRLTYLTPADAADAFIRTVIEPQLQTIKRSAIGATAPLSETWRIPVAAFFAPLIKSAQQYGTMIRAITSSIEQRNILRIGEQSGIQAGIEIIDVEWVRRLNRYAGTLSLSTPLPALDATLAFSPNVYRELHEGQARLRAAELEITLYGHVKQLAQRLPADTYKSFTYFNTGFIPTQILLACLGTETNDFLYAKNYAAAIEALQERSDADVITSTLHRIKSRCTPFSEPEEKLLKVLIQDALKYVRTYPSSISRHELSNLFVYVRAQDVGDHPELALEVATGQDVITSHRSAEKTAKRQAALKAQLATSINWSLVGLEEFQAMVAEESLRSEQLADGIARMNVELRTSATEHLLRSHYCDTAGMSRLIKHKLVHPDHTFILEHAAIIPTPLLKAAWIQELYATKRDDDVLLSLALHFTSTDADSIFGAVEHRTRITSFVFETCTASHITNKQRSALKQSMGDDLWIRFVLTSEVSLRMVEYRRPVTPNDPKPLPRWQESWQPSLAHGLYQLASGLCLSPEQAKQVLHQHTYSEASIFLWMHEGQPQRRRKLTAYLRARETYYRRHRAR